MLVSTLAFFRNVAVVLAALGICFRAQAQAPTWNWAHQANGTGTAWPFDMAVDAAGNTYVVGVLYGAMTLDNGQQLATSAFNDADGFLIKYTPTGAVAWARRLGSAPTYDVANGVALDAAGNVYVAGQYRQQLDLGGRVLTSVGSPAYVAKYDAQGVVQWAQQSIQYNGWEVSSADDVEVDATGNVYLTGRIGWGTTSFGTVSLAPLGQAAYAHYVAKYDASGAVQWAQADGSTMANGAYSSYLALAPGGEAYMTCTMQQTAYFGGQPYPSRGSSDAFVVKYDAQGIRLWVQQLGGPGADQVRRGTVDAAGSLYLPFSFADQAAVGSTTLSSVGNTDLALLKLTDLGLLDWVRTAGGPDGDAAQSATLDPYGNVYLTGLFFGTATVGSGTSFTSAGHYDALLLSYTPQGSLRWGTATGGLNPDDFVHIGFDRTGVGRAIGRYSATLPLGAITLIPPTATSTNWFVASFTDNLPTVATIRTLAPSSGAPGQTVTLTGSGFVGVTAVQFNGTPAASFAVQSATRLTAVVPAGATAGPVSVRTAAGTGSSATVFTPTVLATTAPRVGVLAPHPNPAASVVYVAASLVGSRVQLLDALGRVARETVVSAAAEVSVLGLPPGLYTLRATNMQDQQHAARLVIE